LKVKIGSGNTLLTDGSVQGDNTNLTDYLGQTILAPNRFSAP